jgi:hypothetical protein
MTLKNILLKLIPDKKTDSFQLIECVDSTSADGTIKGKNSIDNKDYIYIIYRIHDVCIINYLS